MREIANVNVAYSPLIVFLPSCCTKELASVSVRKRSRARQAWTGTQILASVKNANRIKIARIGRCGIKSSASVYAKKSPRSVTLITRDGMKIYASASGAISPKTVDNRSGVSMNANASTHEPHDLATSKFQQKLHYKSNCIIIFFDYIFEENLFSVKKI